MLTKEAVYIDKYLKTTGKEGAMFHSVSVSEGPCTISSGFISRFVTYIASLQVV